LEAIEALGLIDYFGEEGVTVIEWAERATPLLPFNVLHIRFAFRASAERELRFEGTMGPYQSLIDSLVARYKGYSRGGSDD
jgi:tRNA A37 threonylcarbamoyladenosine biosynthesis protein TsaE